MKRYIACVSVLLLAGMLVSCGGGGGGDDSPGSASTTNGGTPPNNGGSSASTPGRFEESDVRVTLSPGHWRPSDAKFGWSGGTAVRSEVPGATASFTFSGTSITWIGARNEDAGIALVSVDGGPARRVDLYARPQERRTPVVTLHDLSPGQHTLTIQVTGEKNPAAPSTSPAVVVVDAFDVEAPIVSHLQDRDPDAKYSGTWTSADNIDHSANWSGGAVASAPEPPQGGATFSTTAGDAVTLTFRGTSITWQGGHGPDGGIAAVQVDAGPVTLVDTYGPSQKYQEVMFSKTGLANASHTLTITVTDQKNPASTGTKIFVDAFDVTTPGRRFQEDDLNPKTGLPATTYTGTWTRRNVNRVWSEGAAHTSQEPGARAKFTFTGTGVSYIGCQKNSIGPVRIFVDGVDKGVISNFFDHPVETFQHDRIFSIDGLAFGEHTIEVEAVSSTSFIVVDAFDVRGGQ